MQIVAIQGFLEWFFAGLLASLVGIVTLFAAYVALMHDRSGRQLDPAVRERPAAVEGILGAFVGALKVSQVHAWVYVLRRRPGGDRRRPERHARRARRALARRPLLGRVGDDGHRGRGG